MEIKLLRMHSAPKPLHLWHFVLYHAFHLLLHAKDDDSHE